MVSRGLFSLQSPSDGRMAVSFFPILKQSAADWPWGICGWSLPEPPLEDRLCLNWKGKTKSNEFFHLEK